MLWSHNAGEEGYERCVTGLGMVNPGYLFFIHSYIQLALGNRKIYLFSSQHMSSAWAAPLSNLVSLDRSVLHKETTLERADFILKLLMFVTAEKKRECLQFSLSPVFVSCCPQGFKQGQAEYVQTMEAQTNRPRR